MKIRKKLMISVCYKNRFPNTFLFSYLSFLNMDLLFISTNQKSNAMVA
jgi:hypothetical protein